MGGGGFTLVGGGAMAGQGLGLHHANKFNTISNIHKRGDRGECQPVSASALSGNIKYYTIAEIHGRSKDSSGG